MKFLVLALCVCAANAASLTSGSKAGTNAESTASNVPATPAVAAVDLAASPVKTASRTGVSPATKIIGTPAVTAAKVVATPAIVAAKSDAAPAVAAAKAVATPTEATAEVATVPVVAAANAAPSASSSANANARASIVREKSDVGLDGYIFGYETDSGIVVESTGTLKNVNGTDALVMKGSYEYIAADGSKVKVTYVADENGYRAESESLPVAPPTPQIILDALEYIATHPKWVDPSVKN